MKDVVYRTALLYMRFIRIQWDLVCQMGGGTYLHSAVITVRNTEIQPLSRLHLRT